MDGQFIVFFLALGVPLVFGACIGAAFRGRFGRGLGLVTLALGLAGLLYGALTFTTYRDGYGLFAWVLQILMAGGVFCFGGACWLAARRKRQASPIFRMARPNSLPGLPLSPAPIQAPKAMMAKAPKKMPKTLSTRTSR